jgi:hypothetical protein
MHIASKHQEAVSARQRSHLATATAVTGNRKARHMTEASDAAVEGTAARDSPTALTSAVPPVVATAPVTLPPVVTTASAAVASVHTNEYLQTYSHPQHHNR